MVLVKSLTYLIEDEIQQTQNIIKENHDILFKRKELLKEKDDTFSSESIFKRIIEFTKFLINHVRRETNHSLGRVHLDWINDVLCDLLYILEPTDFIKRSSLAAKFGIENYDKWAFAYWPRRTGKSFINGIILVAVLMGKPSGSMVVQSLNMKSALETILPFRSHIQNLFDSFGLKDVEPIRMFGQNGVRFINWYGVQEILSGRHTQNNLPYYAFSSIQIISGSEDAGRGITKDIYLIDESEFVKEGSKRNFLMNTKRKGTIMIAISSEDWKNKNPRVDKMRKLSDIATVSVFRPICDDCAGNPNFKKASCSHNSDPPWLSESADLKRVTESFLDNQKISLMEQFGGGIIFGGNVFKIPEYRRLEEFYMETRPAPIRMIICAIDPALSRQEGASEFASVIIGFPEYHTEVDDSQCNYMEVSYFFFLLSNI